MSKYEQTNVIKLVESMHCDSVIFYEFAAGN